MVLGICERLFLSIKVLIMLCPMGLGICERLYQANCQCCVVQMGLGICERLFLNIKVTVKCCVVQWAWVSVNVFF